MGSSQTPCVMEGGRGGNELEAAMHSGGRAGLGQSEAICKLGILSCAGLQIEALAAEFGEARPNNVSYKVL